MAVACAKAKGWHDIHFERRVLQVAKSKNGDGRHVPLSPQCLRDLEGYIYGARPQLLKNGRDTGKLLVSLGRGGMKPVTAAHRLAVLRGRSGIARPFGLHTLRHSIATHLLESGMALAQVSRFLGHRSLESTQVYTHLLNDEL